MLFKDIKQNYPVYILDKDSLELTQGTVRTVSFPRMAINQTTGKNELLVDVGITVDNNTATYAIPENLSVTYAGNLILSTDKQGLSNELEAMKNTAEQVLSSVDRLKQILEKSSKLLMELNPAFREKQETECRFNNLESHVSEMKSTVQELKDMITELMKSKTA